MYQTIFVTDLNNRMLDILHLEWFSVNFESLFFFAEFQFKPLTLQAKLCTLWHVSVGEVAGNLEGISWFMLQQLWTLCSHCCWFIDWFICVCSGELKKLWMDFDLFSGR